MKMEHTFDTKRTEFDQDTIVNYHVRPIFKSFHFNRSKYCIRMNPLIQYHTFQHHKVDSCMGVDPSFRVEVSVSTHDLQSNPFWPASTVVFSSNSDYNLFGQIASDYETQSRSDLEIQVYHDIVFAKI